MTVLRLNDHVAQRFLLLCSNRVSESCVCFLLAVPATTAGFDCTLDQSSDSRSGPGPQMRHVGRPPLASEASLTASRSQRTAANVSAFKWEDVLMCHPSLFICVCTISKCSESSMEIYACTGIPFHPHSS